MVAEVQVGSEDHGIFACPAGTLYNSPSFNLPRSLCKVPELLARSDLVLRARILAATTKLSNDEALVVPEYALVPIRVVKQNPIDATAPRPGALPRRIVRRVGGTVFEGGLRYSTTGDTFPEVNSLKPGDEIVAFLIYNRDEQVYSLTAASWSVFRVVDERIGSLTAACAPDRKDLPTDARALLDNLQQPTEQRR
jgi:hypothetical protein